MRELAMNEQDMTEEKKGFWYKTGEFFGKSLNDATESPLTAACLTAGAAIGVGAAAPIVAGCAVAGAAVVGINNAFGANDKEENKDEQRDEKEGN